MDDARLREVAHRARLQTAIDGPAGAGKSTVGKGVASRLRAPYLDTGLMYRAVTWLGIQAGLAPADTAAHARLATETDFASAADGYALLVNGQPVEWELRSAGVDALVSEVSAHAAVRSVLVEKQRAFANDRITVMVGRDIGTIVLPRAPVKLWITASAEERARRRLEEGLGGSGGLAVDDVARLIRVRDALDASRSVSPLLKATDAVAIETDRLDKAGAIEASISVIRRALEPLEVC
jgi:cytidylate kinase